jgi:hypothetical protein
MVMTLARRLAKGLLASGVSGLLFFATPTLGAGGDAAQWIALETAPLRGVTGAPAIRAELLPLPGFGLGLGWGTTDQKSAVEGQRDHRETLDLEALWYPQLATLFGSSGRARRADAPGLMPFLGVGIRREEAWYAREHERSAITWARTDSGRYDSWVDHDESLAVSQTVGVRLLGSHMLTASLRYVRDEVTSRKRERQSADIRDADAVSADEGGRARVTGQVVLHAGILLR